MVFNCIYFRHLYIIIYLLPFPFNNFISKPPNKLKIQYVFYLHPTYPIPKMITVMLLKHVSCNTCVYNKSWQHDLKVHICSPSLQHVFTTQRIMPLFNTSLFNTSLFNTCLSKRLYKVVFRAWLFSKCFQQISQHTA